MGHQVAKEFQPGEEVLVYKPIRKVGRAEKLLHHWHGPYVVQRKTASLNYEVKQKDKRKTEMKLTNHTTVKQERPIRSTNQE
jgi:hypothetical protein